jgi:hypothetical protein
MIIFVKKHCVIAINIVFITNQVKCLEAVPFGSFTKYVVTPISEDRNNALFVGYPHYNDAYFTKGR